MTGTCYFCGAEGDSHQEQIFDHIFQALICEKCDRFSALTVYGEWVDSDCNMSQYRREHDYYWRSVKGDNRDKKEMSPLPRDRI